MRTQDECLDLLASTTKEMEKELGIKIRNGQASVAVKKTLAWVLKGEQKPSLIRLLAE